jgi:type I restriction enzyme, R subunit
VTSPYGEDELIEGPATELLAEIGWGTANAYSEGYGPNAITGRETLSEVVLRERLIPLLVRLNPDLPPEGLLQAVDAITADRSILDPTRANADVYRLLRNGIKVRVPDDTGGETIETVRIIDWVNPANNDFFAARQFWVTGDMYKRRADIVGFVNGIPLVLIEVKASHKNLELAYKNNIKDYRTAIPQIFWPNALIVLSNGSDARVGSVSAPWEHYGEWKRINAEGDAGIVSLETIFRGTLEPSRLLDLVENFTLFQEMRGGLVKLIAKNHQYLGVNNAIEALHEIEDRQGRLGVFWHTQGSGKSVSVAFFTQKVLRKVRGNWTFLIVTDRTELDDQIYKTFQDCGLVTEGHVQATSGEDLKRLLAEDHRYVFTLIHKFHTERGETYPMLSDRSDIVVVTDEAHRSQYDVLALNMRNALPNASFIGFTGTPLIVGEEKTKEVFGDYVSIYDFKQSIDDGATVPLYYENRIPELQLTNEDFNADMEAILDAADLDEAQERQLSREFSREYHLITREDRLDKVAEDLVQHFVGRGFMGKAMVVSIDKATAIRMYDKIRARWSSYINDLEASLPTIEENERARVQEMIDYMTATDMAVVVSQAQNEVTDMAEKGLDIVWHRQRIVHEDLETRFKDPDDPFRIVFVCAMWMTGFDVPSCSTIYLDKPMRNHTLMQTIARANRVWRDKTNGLIVDYVGVFRDLQRALAIYGTGAGGLATPGEMPVMPKSELLEALREELKESAAFCLAHGVSIEGLLGLKAFEYVKLRDDAVDLLLATPGTKSEFLHRADHVDRLFKAILPDPQANEFGPYRAVFVNIAERIRSLTPVADISEVMDAVENLLDDSVAAKAYVIAAAESEDGGHLIDLSQIDFEALATKFDTGRRHIEAERLKGSLAAKLISLVRANPTRLDYMERFQALIDEYNAGSLNVEQFFQQLVTFARSLSQEEQRGIAENLTEEQLAVFDLLTKPDLRLSEKETAEVRRVAQELLDTLKREKLVLDWRKRQQTRASVRLCIEQTLDWLPEVYTPELFGEKCDAVYQHVFDSYFGEGRSVYGAA